MTTYTNMQKTSIWQDIPGSCLHPEMSGACPPLLHCTYFTADLTLTVNLDEESLCFDIRLSHASHTLTWSVVLDILGKFGKSSVYPGGL